jgi:replicative DNA helicase
MSKERKDKNKSLQVNYDYFENVIASQALTNNYYTSLVLDHLIPENFKSEGNRLVTGIVRDFFQKRKTLPTITEIKSYLKTDAEKVTLKNALMTYQGIDLNGSMDELIENSELYFKEKTVFNSVNTIVNEFINDKKDYGRFLQMFENACNISLVSDTGLDFYGDYKKILTELGSKNETLPIGWKFMDEKIGGGLMKNGRALYLFLGPTNVGKSIFLGNIASNLAEQGKTTVLISLEMPEMMYAKRISSHLSKIPVNSISENISSLEAYFEEVSEKKKQKLIIKEFPPKAITVAGIKSYVESLIKRGIKPEVLVIDYLGLLKSLTGDNSYEQGKNVAEELRALSYYFNIPIVSAIQTNREGMDGPSLETVSESLGVAFTADVVWGIYQEEGDYDLGVIKVSNIKNRLGPKHGAVAMKIDYSTLTLSEEEDYPGMASGKRAGVDEITRLEQTLENIKPKGK